MLDEQWLSLTQDWQAQPFEKTDMAALVKQTKRRTYLGKIAVGTRYYCHNQYICHVYLWVLCRYVVDSNASVFVLWRYRLNYFCLLRI